MNVPVVYLSLFEADNGQLWTARLAGEWQVATEHSEAYDAPQLEVGQPCTDLDLLQMQEVTRYGVAGDTGELVLMPALADRSVVTRLETLFKVMPGAELVLYVSTPLWVMVQLGAPAMAVADIPILRPSDTWFGPSTLAGELCYASRTTGRLRRDALPSLPHRAITSVQIRNRSSKPLALDRMNVPVVYLSLFEADNGQLWTEDVLLEHADEEELVPLRLLPRQHTSMRVVTRPRRKPENALVRAFSSLFS
jgi:hypothetical protein